MSQQSNEYSRMADEQISELLRLPGSDFEPEAHTLLIEEAKKRGIPIPCIQTTESNSPNKTIRANVIAPSMDTSDGVPDILQVMIVTNMDDAEMLKRILDSESIYYEIQSIHVGGKEFPAALLIDVKMQHVFFHKISILALHGSVPLW